MAINIGILTAGGDSPGLNAAIRAVGKAAIRAHGMTMVAVPLRDVAGRIRSVPLDHSWVVSARRLGISLGD